MVRPASMFMRIDFPDRKLATVADVVAFLDRAANGGLKTPGKRETVGELKRVIREARDALREIIKAS